jgi:hypothetical protein
MPSTTHCTQVGQSALWNKSAFDDSAIFIGNPYQVLDNQLFKSLQTFVYRKDAAAFCKQWDLPTRDIKRVSSRFQFGYAIGLGRSYFVPDCAESRLIAHAMGCVVNRVEISL